jgi:hypothetical protein
MTKFQASKSEVKSATQSDVTDLPTELAPGALCGSFACGGCYDGGEGKFIHPPRAGWNQARLLDLDRAKTESTKGTS